MCRLQQHGQEDWLCLTKTVDVWAYLSYKPRISMERKFPQVQKDLLTFEDTIILRQQVTSFQHL